MKYCTISKEQKNKQNRNVYGDIASLSERSIKRLVAKNEKIKININTHFRKDK